MIESTSKTPDAAYRGHDFTLIVAGASELNEDVLDALYEAGCDDATPSLQYGALHLAFTRTAPTLKDAIIGAISNVLNSGLPVRVLRVDGCALVSQSEIARRMGRTRQLVFQYITGERGPGNFPAPVGALAEKQPLWRWGAVTDWLASHELLASEEHKRAVVIEAINSALERRRMPAGLVEDVERALRAVGA